MQKTKIEWCDFTINPVKGKCPMGCSYCYARRMYNRFKWKFEIRWYPPAFDILDMLTLKKKPARIFVGSTFELFHESLPYNWMEYNLLTAKKYPQHTFIFLTKRPENLIKWSPFPDNCEIGVSVTANGDMTRAYYGLSQIEASLKFISFEPLFGYIGMSDHVNIKEWLNWVIIGQQTPVSQKTTPRISWLKEIVEACDKASIPVFLKDNLNSVFAQNILNGDIGRYDGYMLPRWAGKLTGDNRRILRQEFPDGKKITS